MKLVVLTLLFLCACAPYGGLAKHAYIAAQHDYACDEDNVTVRQIRRGSFDVRACGQQAIYQCHGGHGRCANLSDLAVKRAQAEFGCQGALQAVEVSAYSFSVNGCGQRIFYHCEMRNGRADCLSQGATLN
jgi:hypothetical protein